MALYRQTSAGRSIHDAWKTPALFLTLIGFLAAVLFLRPAGITGYAVIDNVSECQTLDTQGDTYYVNETFSAAGDCITIAASDIVFNCNNTLLTGPRSGTAVNVTADNVTVEECVFVDFKYGISTNASNGTFSHNTATLNISGAGIFLEEGSSNNNAVNNTVYTSTTSNSWGIYLNSASDNAIENNTVNTTAGNGFGIYVLSSSHRNNISLNVINTSGNNGYGIYLLTGSSNNTVAENTVNALSGSSNYPVFISTDANGNNISHNTLSAASSSAIGMRSTSSQENIMYNNTLTITGSTGKGILLTTSNATTVEANSILINVSSGHGFGTSSTSSNNTILDNTITIYGSSAVGINLDTGPENTFVNNTVMLMDTASTFGLNVLTSSPGNTFTNNTFLAATDATNLFMQFATVHNTTLTGNTITGSPRVISFTNSLNTVIDRNTITANGTSSYYAILFDSKENSANITNNTIITSGAAAMDGILLSSNGTFFIINNTINMTEKSTGDGIHIEEQLNESLIMGNLIMFNKSGSYGIYAGFDNDNITENTIIDRESGSGGIIIYGSNISISGNTVTAAGTSTRGILFQAGSSLNSADGNTISTAGSSLATGIYLIDSENNTFTNNTISTEGAGANGIWLQRSRHQTILNNTITAVQAAPFVIYASTTASNVNDTTYFDHTISNNSGNGRPTLSYRDSDDVVVNTSDFDYIHIYNATSVTIEDIDVTDRSGMAVISSGNVTVDNYTMVSGLGTTFVLEALHIGNLTVRDSGFNATGSLAEGIFAYNVSNIRYLGSITGKHKNTKSNLSYFGNDYASVEFSDAVFNTSGSSFEDLMAIGTTSVFVNASQDTDMNQSALITFYGLSMVDPVLYVDFTDTGSYDVCNETYCQNSSYSGDTLNFTAAHFTTYKVEDNYTAPAEESSAPESGGSSALPIMTSASVSEISLDFGTGQTFTMGKGSIVKFKFDDDIHRLIANRINDDSVAFTSRSDPLNFVLKAGESMEIDLNADGNANLRVTLDAIEKGFANVTMRLSADPVEMKEPAQEQVIIGSEEAAQIEEQPKPVEDISQEKGEGSEVENPTEALLAVIMMLTAAALIAVFTSSWIRERGNGMAITRHVKPLIISTARICHKISSSALKLTARKSRSLLTRNQLNKIENARRRTARKEKRLLKERKQEYLKNLKKPGLQKAGGANARRTRQQGPGTITQQQTDMIERFRLKSLGSGYKSKKGGSLITAGKKSRKMVQQQLDAIEEVRLKSLKKAATVKNLRP